MNILGNLTTKNKITAFIVDSTGKITRQTIPYESDSFYIGSEPNRRSYIIRHERVYKQPQERYPISFYNWNNPEPIDMLENNQPQLTSLSLKKILDNKVVTDLFSKENDRENLMFWLIVGNLILTGVIFLALTGVINFNG